MTDQYVVCPKCGKKFPLSEAISHQIETRLAKAHARQLEEVEMKYRNRENARVEAIEAKHGAERERVQKAATKAARDQLSGKMEKLTAKVGTYERQVSFLKNKQQDLKDKLASVDEEVQRKVSARLRVERLRLTEDAQANAEKTFKLKIAESKKQNEDLSKKIAELQRKANQGSVQLQGEVQELDIQDILERYFPNDDILPIAAGKKGGDVKQSVKLRSGKVVGTILWESKRTKAWSDGWIEKLKLDQQNSKADLAAIVTEALPKGVSSFGFKDEVWITELRYVLGLATALRENLKSLNQMKAVVANRTGKMQQVYGYLTGSQFKLRVDNILSAFKAMQEGLEAERRAMERSWASREKQIKRFITNMAGMYKDLQGMGTPLPNVKLLEIT